MKPEVGYTPALRIAVMPHSALAAVVAFSAVTLIDNERVPCMHIKKPEYANTSP